MKVALAQISGVWLDKEKTTRCIEQKIEEAGKASADLIKFGEGILPGYPFWLFFLLILSQGNEDWHI